MRRMAAAAAAAVAPPVAVAAPGSIGRHGREESISSLIVLVYDLGHLSASSDDLPPDWGPLFNHGFSLGLDTDDPVSAFITVCFSDAYSNTLPHASWTETDT